MRREHDCGPGTQGAYGASDGRLVSAHSTCDEKPKPVAVAALRVVQLAVDPDASAADLAAAVVADPALSLQVLKLVNSAAFMLRGEVSDVKRAATLLGANGLRNLALSLVVSGMAPPSEEGRVLLANSVRRALAAQAIGRALGVRQVDEYFTAGLFLDVGFLACGRDDLGWAASVASRPAAHRVVVERAAGRTPHPQRGAELALEYALPADTVQAIAHHHDDVAPEGQLASACWLAERFAGVFEGGDLVRSRELALDAAQSIGLEAEAVEEILEELPQAVLGAAAAFDRDLGEQPDLEALIRDANRSLVALNRDYELIVRQLQTLIEQKEELEQQLKAANKRLATEAATDPLTGLWNKRAFQRELDRDLARAARSGEPLSLLVLDIDHFKRFNDDFGHAVGDEVLRSLGHLLPSCVRQGDYPARYGGEEFVVVLPSTGTAGARLAAERVRQQICGMRLADPNIPPVTASIGIGTVQGSDCGARAAELFERADRALYAAKAAGRNRVSSAVDDGDASVDRAAQALGVVVGVGPQAQPEPKVDGCGILAR